MDVTDYLNTYKLSAHDLAMKIILDVIETTRHHGHGGDRHQPLSL